MEEKLSLEDFIKQIPKAELHVHLEGTFEPEEMFRLAKRNGIQLKYSNVEEVRSAYTFNGLKDYLQLYNEGASVLTTQQDFYDIAWDYLVRAHSEGVRYAEISFDPQTHMKRGVKIKAMVEGMQQAIHNAEASLNISAKVIMCVVRDEDPEAALAAFEEALKYRDTIVAIGLDSTEAGNPPSKFAALFDRANAEGFFTVAHAGQEGPAEYIWEALNVLKVSRIDHGHAFLTDKVLMALLSEKKIPLTVCPISNLKLKLIDKMENHPLRDMMSTGLVATINSDSPSYFGAYIYENYLAVAKALHLSREEISELAKNSFKACFLPEAKKAELIAEVDKFMAENS